MTEKDGITNDYSRTGEFDASYAYDPNGNITSLNRRYNGTKIDSLTYFIDNDSDKLNKLKDIANHTESGIKDLEYTGTGYFDAYDYTYDYSGNLASDYLEGLTDNLRRSVWTPDNKPEFMEFGSNTSPVSRMEFYYDAGGNRVMKSSTGSSSSHEISPFVLPNLELYVRGADGNILGIYQAQVATENVGIYGADGNPVPSRRFIDSRVLNPTGLDEFAYYQDLDSVQVEDYLHSAERDTGVDRLSLNNEYVSTRWYIYGNSVHGRFSEARPYGKRYQVYNYDTVPSQSDFYRKLDYKKYEVHDHLGNVRQVYGDARYFGFNGSNAEAGLTLKEQSSYYPFGMQIASLSYSREDYTFGMQGMIRDDEMKGAGNSYAAKYWQYDSRLGRRWNLDPKFTGSESRYAAFSNNPIIYVDPLGDFRTKFGAWLYKLIHGGEISQDKGSGQWFVGKDVEYTGEGAGVAYQRRFDWNGGNQPYTGSGWGHTGRSLAANVFGVNGQASSLFDLGWNSVLQNSSVQLTGDLLEQVKQDPAVQRLENSIVSAAQSDSRFGNEAFTFPYKQGVQLGGQRGSLNPLDPSSTQTWEVAANPLTWAVRSVNIEVQVKVSAEGVMNITYQFTDNFDLRPERGGKIYFGGSGNSPFSSGGGNRPWQYNVATSILGVPYHDVVGGNDKLKINARWQSNR